LFRKLAGTVVLILIVLSVTGVPALARSVTQRVDVTPSGVAPNGSSWWPVMSADGRYIAFHSWATNLVPNDANGAYDIFVWDRALRTTRLVSLSATGTQANAACTYPAISADGNVVAFLSAASNLGGTTVNGKQQVYVRDSEAGVTELVSVSTSGDVADHDCEWCAVSGDGRYVAFDSAATNLIPGGNPHIGVYLRDRQLGTTQCISVSTSGVLANYDALKPRLTPDGRFVLFCSLASNLVAGDTNGSKDLFLRDLQNGTTERISVSDVTGDQGDSGSAAAPPPAMTPDGRFIAFASEADNLVPSDTNGLWDIFLRDRLEGRTELISVSSSGQQGNGISGHAVGGLAISADARYIVFPSLATNFAPGDPGSFWDTFVRDLQDRTTDLLSVSTTGGAGNADSGENSVGISADGSAIVFDSKATDLVPAVADAFTHVYLRVATTPTDPPTVVIDDGGAYTTSAQVRLTIDSESWTQVRFRNESGDWSAWEPSVATKGWTLSSGDGLKQVLVQGSAPALFAESDVSSAQIVLDTAPPADLSISINGGAATTTSPEVVLTLSASGAAEMRLRNESGDWSPWQPFATSADWLLSPHRETKTVSLQCRDAAGNLSQVASATIRLIWFTDVPNDFWAYADIVGCADAGIVQGYDDGTYEPAVSVLRDQMAVFISRAVAGGDASVPAGPAEATFDDVPPDYWAYQYIEYAVSHDVIAGYDDSLYHPADAVDRGQMAVFVARAKGWVGLHDDMTLAPELFPDVPAGFWSGTAIEACVANGVVHGYDDGSYRPDAAVTRDQMAVYIARAFGLE
jgi:Tol biopolymer transport system component